MSLRESEVFKSPRRRRKKPELAIQKAVAAYLRKVGCLVAVTDAGSAHKAGAYHGAAVPPGWPDLTCLTGDGKFLGVECKAPKGRQSNLQKQMQYQIQQRGGLYVIARSIDDVREVLLR